MKNLHYHLLALFTTIVWGTTFVSTKVLLQHGLTPATIFFYRSLAAWLIIWVVSPKRLWANSLKDEFMFLLLGLTGGSVYFLAENTALKYTLASNVSLIICTAPLATAFLSHLWVKGERLRKNLICGSLLALTGVALVIFNGNFILKLSPLGDILTITAAFLWGCYTIFLKRLDAKYPILFITRKVFFYGLLTLLPSFFFSPLITDLTLLTRPVVLSNLLFLGIIASMLCFYLWNIALKHLGAIRTTNYIYFTPIVTLIASFLFIDEKITPIALLGAAFVIGGVYWAELKVEN
ncbi:MAG: DMT family transporter [Bacteroidales bacterium]|jgi:drug/metabolite transporter (DMT)-like permease|nr:DMT family transporter [Bacteroidales bacterium]